MGFYKSPLNTPLAFSLRTHGIGNGGYVLLPFLEIFLLVAWCIYAILIPGQRMAQLIPYACRRTDVIVSINMLSGHTPFNGKYLVQREYKQEASPRSIKPLNYLSRPGPINLL